MWQIVDDSDFGYKLSAEYRFKNREVMLELSYRGDGGARRSGTCDSAIEGREAIDYSIQETCSQAACCSIRRIGSTFMRRWATRC